MDSLLPEIANAYVEPSAVIGLGAWGQAVAEELRLALSDRSPLLAKACPILLLDEGAADAADRVKALLRETRRAEVLRSLQRDGLMQLDPEIAPTTHLYLIASLEEDAELQQTRALADLAEQSAGQIRAAISPRAIVRLGDDHRMPDLVRPGEPLRFPLFVTEPITSQGLIVSESEYRTAVVEVLVAALQPGGGQLLASGRGELGTVGVAWLRWSAADTRTAAAEQLAAHALKEWVRPPGRAAAGAASTPPVATADGSAERIRTLLDGLPFTPLLGSGGWRLIPDLPAGSPANAEAAPYWRRLVSLLPRWAPRWERRLERNRIRRAEHEAAQLEHTALLARGDWDPFSSDGVASARPVQRLRDETDDLARDLATLERLGRLPPLSLVAPGVGGIYLLGMLIWWLRNGSTAAAVVWLLLCAIALWGYAWGRETLLRQLTARLRCAIGERMVAAIQPTLVEHWCELDAVHAERRREALAWWESFQAADTSLGRSVPEQQEHCGALHRPLVSAEGLERVRTGVITLLPAFLRSLPPANLRSDEQPKQLLDRLRAHAERFLQERMPLDVAQITMQTYGEHLSDHLQRSVCDLLDWSRPLVARSVSELDSQRWLFWPRGLPCPPVPAGVHTQAAIGSAALITVVRNLSVR